jgi:cytochrome c
MISNAQEAAQEWVENAKNFYLSAGKKMALAEFSDPDGMFARGEMYIYVLDLHGTMLAHGINKKFVGEDFMHFTDSDGKAFIREIVESAEMEESSWVEYKWYNPVTKQWNFKKTYFEVVDDLILCSAVYH